MRSIKEGKNQILVVASDLLKEKGLEEFNMRTIAKNASVSIGTVYNYYPSKSDLVFDIMDKLLKECCSVIHSDENDRIIDKLRTIYFQMLSYFNLFQSNLMSDLVVLASSKRNPKGNVEMHHMKIFQDAFYQIFQDHQDEIDPRLYSVLGINGAIEFILHNFNLMIRKNTKDFSAMEFLIQKILKK